MRNAVRRSGVDCASRSFFGGSWRESTAPGAASAARAGVWVSFAGRSAVLRRGRFGPALLRNALRCSCRAVACGDRGVSCDMGRRPLVRRRWRLGCGVAAWPGMPPWPPRPPRSPRQFRLRSRTLLCPVVPRESSESLARPPPRRVRMSHAARQSSGASRRSAPAALSQPRGASVPDAGASPRRPPSCAGNYPSARNRVVGAHAQSRPTGSGLPRASLASTAAPRPGRRFSIPAGAGRGPAGCGRWRATTATGAGPTRPGWCISMRPPAAGRHAERFLDGFEGILQALPGTCYRGSSSAALSPRRGVRAS